MKTLVALYAGSDCTHEFDVIFNGKSAFALSLEWAFSIENVSEICIFATKKTNDKIKDIFALGLNKQNDISIKIILLEEYKASSDCKSWSIHDLLVCMAEEMKNTASDFVLYSYADCPFLNKALTKEIIETHIRYCAEYTFADGYPLGFAAEAIDGGAVNLLATLSENNDCPVKRNGIFSLMKKDINSFEIENVIASKDFRQLRLSFTCDTKLNTLSCENLYKKLSDKDCESMLALEISELAERDVNILKTVPSFYEIQLTEKVSSEDVFTPYPILYKNKYGKDLLSSESFENMPFEAFCSLIKHIAEVSESAVISLSAWGEALLYPFFLEAVREVLKYKGLSVLIETSGENVTEELANKVAAIISDSPVRTGEYPPVIWIVNVDAINQDIYSVMHHGCSNDAFEKSCNAVSILASRFSNAVYPQFLRVNENECQLEAFFRFWKEKESPSKGLLIIKKYDDCCALLPPNKPADLSPIERNPCWHLRRDMVILANGDVPLCKDAGLIGIGNVFKESIEDVWNKISSSLAEHICNNYSKKCQVCDEFYTFNF